MLMSYFDYTFCSNQTFFFGLFFLLRCVSFQYMAIRRMGWHRGRRPDAHVGRPTSFLWPDGKRTGAVGPPGGESICQVCSLGFLFFFLKMGFSGLSPILDELNGCANFLAERKTDFCDKHAWLTGLLADCRTACLCGYLFVLFVCQAVNIFNLQFQTSEDAFRDIKLSNVTKNSLYSQEKQLVCCIPFSCFLIVAQNHVSHL